MAKTKTTPIEVVRIESVDSETDRVYVYREDPYVNHVLRVKAGKYKVGQSISEDDQKEEG